MACSPLRWVAQICWACAIVTSLARASATLADLPDGSTRDAGAPKGPASDEIERLGAPRFSEREAATLALVESTNATEILRKAIQSEDPEVSWRAEELLEQIERRALSLPTLVTLHPADRTLTAAVRRIEATSGMQTLLESATARNPIEVTSVERVAFWNALARLQLDARVEPEAESQATFFRSRLLPTLRLTPTPNLPPMAHVGPFRLALREVVPLSRTRVRFSPTSREGSPEAAERYEYRFEWLIEPRLRFRVLTVPRVLDAVSTDGSLVALENDPLGQGGIEGDPRHFSQNARFSFVLQSLQPSAETIGRLRVRATAEVEGRRERPTTHPFDLEGTIAQIDQPVRLDDFTLIDCRAEVPEGSRVCTLEFTLQSDDWSEMFLPHRFNRQRFQQIPRALELVLSQLEVLDETGEPMRPSGSRSLRPTPQGVRVFSQLDLKPGRKPASLSVQTSIRETRDWTFELANVPLEGVRYGQP